MHLIAYFCLLLAMLVSLFASAYAGYAAWRGPVAAGGKNDPERLLPWLEKGHLVQTVLMTFAAAMLAGALSAGDYSLKYVADYTDQFLPQFYKLTAFWAGQAGSLFFWAWLTALFGAAFGFSRGYKGLTTRTKAVYWCLFFAVTAFFLLLLTSWNNPFVLLDPAPQDGRGLNPLLRNVGMIFHPPLLFLGYAGFTIPACLGLAQALTGGHERGEPSWIHAARDYTVVSWLFLTAGIILGAWWSYMELGWGGYWAWDPVENASLIPWLVGTGFLHTSVVQERRGTLGRANVVLAGLTLATCFFATYLVRSGVVDSLHAFGASEVAGPLLLFLFAILGVTLLAAFAGRPGGTGELSGIVSREGFLFLAMWLLMALGLVIGLGTLWPVISQLWETNPVGLDQGFYNRVCLPLFAILALFLAVCPWLGWKGGLRDKKAFMALAGAFAGFAAVLATLGVTLPLALFGAASALTALCGIALLFFRDPGVRTRRSLAAYGVHAGLALCVLGVAVSGPYQVEVEAQLSPGEHTFIQGYQVTYKGLSEKNTPGMAMIEAELDVTRDGEHVGVMRPQRRAYRKYDQPFAEVGTVFSLGAEVYSTLLGADREGQAVFKISVHPLVNWIWIGGTMMSVLPFLGLGLGLGRGKSGGRGEN